MANVSLSGRMSAQRTLRVAHPPWTAVTLALCTVGATSTMLLALRSPHVEYPLATGLVTSYYIVAPAVIGLLWCRRRPASRFGPYLILFGATGWLLGLQSATAPLVHTLAVMGDFVFIALNVYLCLAFPSGRLRQPLDRALNGLFILALAQFALPWLFLAPALQGGGPLSRCVPGCPGNPLQVAEAPHLIGTLGDIEVAVAVIAVLGVVLRFLYRLATSTRPQRRALQGVALSSLLLLPLFATFHLVVTFAPGATDLIDGLAWLLVAARIVFPLGFLAVLLQADLFAAAAQRRLMRALADGPTPARWQAAVRRALDDPRLHVGFWDARAGEYRDDTGTPVTPGDRGWFPVERDGRPVAVIAGDESLRDDPELVAAAASATLVAVERGDLVGELRASRTRLVQASDAARGQLQRDLHDGAQQRLVALRMRLGLATDTAPDRASRHELSSLLRDLDNALHEVRELARGIYPPTLTAYGVAEALRGLPSGDAHVRVHDAGIGRYAPHVENAIYFVCVEAIQNAMKHAPGASIEVALGSDGSRVWLRVTDDGPGFDPARAATGAGLTNMTDRLVAIGGTLSVDTTPARGTCVRGTVPIGADAASVPR